jgi:hypothetical protein
MIISEKIFETTREGRNGGIPSGSGRACARYPEEG